MSPVLRVASPPAKPRLIFDGDCGFCRRRAARLQRAIGDAVDYLPFQDGTVARDHPEIPPEKLREALHLILPDGSVCSGAEAVFRSLAAGGVHRRLFWCYRKVPFFARLTELMYRQAAARRHFF